MKKIAVSMIVMFTMNSWAATVGEESAIGCEKERQAFEKADTRWQRLSNDEQRRFPSYLSIAHDAENTWRACAGLPPVQATLAERFATVRGEQ
ncbi:MAG: hypothetical protein KDJ39_17040 [Gammaproteobacteria bacterium]|nr:hypothetical protein [Gammaproteobacteria bacterium]